MLFEAGPFCFNPRTFEHMKWMPLIVVLLALGCKTQTCVDCVDNAGNQFTFCDPPESPFTNMQCGEEYTK